MKNKMCCYSGSFACKTHQINFHIASVKKELVAVFREFTFPFRKRFYIYKLYASVLLRVYMIKFSRCTPIEKASKYNGVIVMFKAQANAIIRETHKKRKPFATGGVVEKKGEEIVIGDRVGENEFYKSGEHIDLNNFPTISTFCTNSCRPNDK